MAELRPAEILLSEAQIQKRVAEMATSLPTGVGIQAVYDRSTLIRSAIEMARSA